MNEAKKNMDGIGGRGESVTGAYASEKCADHPSMDAHRKRAFFLVSHFWIQKPKNVCMPNKHVAEHGMTTTTTT